MKVFMIVERTDYDGSGNMSCWSTYDLAKEELQRIYLSYPAGIHTSWLLKENCIEAEGTEIYIQEMDVDPKEEE